MAKQDAFLLRVWHDERQWAARLEHLPNGAVLRFTSAGALIAYLSGLSGDAALGPAAGGEDGSATMADTGGKDDDPLTAKS